MSDAELLDKTRTTLQHAERALRNLLKSHDVRAKVDAGLARCAITDLLISDYSISAITSQKLQEQGLAMDLAEREIQEDHPFCSRELNR